MSIVLPIALALLAGGCQAILGIDPDARHEGVAGSSVDASSFDALSDAPIFDAGGDVTFVDAKVDCTIDSDCSIDAHAACEKGICNAGRCELVSRDGLACGADGTCNGYACIGSDTTLSLAHDTSCIRASDGLVWCWGDDSSGQLGDGQTVARSTPYLVPRIGEDLTAATSISVGYTHVCAITIGGVVVCWGSNTYGESSGPDAGASIGPTLAYDAPPAKAVAVGWGHTCVLGTGSDVWCWGNNAEGEIGSGVATHTAVKQPRRIDSFPNVTAISSVGDTVCALTGFDVFCWGDNTWGQVGEGCSDSFCAHPVYVEDLAPDGGSVSAIEIKTSEGAACALLLPGGNVACWGSSRAGQLGDDRHFAFFDDGGGSIPSPIPEAVVAIDDDDNDSPITGVDAIFGGTGSHFCAHIPGRVRVDCWGQNMSDELGIGAAGNYNVATPTTLDAPVAVGDTHTCFVQRDERTAVWCFGHAQAGQTGDGAAITEHVQATPAIVKFPGALGGVARLRATQ